MMEGDTNAVQGRYIRVPICVTKVPRMTSIARVWRGGG